jgi:hypothetical protein
MKKQLDKMLIATFLTTIFYSATYPYIHKEIIANVSDSLIAITQIINCLSIVVFGGLWNRCSDKLFRHYPLFCVLESVLSILSTAFAILTKNIIAYYIVDTLIFAVVTRNICCGGVKLRAIRYDSEEKREHFDNNNNSASAVATIIGSLIAIVLDLDFSLMLILATIGNTIDNFFYLFIFKTTAKKSKIRERG